MVKSQFIVSYKTRAYNDFKLHSQLINSKTEPKKTVDKILGTYIITIDFNIKMAPTIQFKQYNLLWVRQDDS